MTTNPQAEEQSRGTENEQEEKPLGVRLVERLKGNIRRTKQDVIDHPYVFGSYVFVYGTLGLWLTYRYRCLRKAQDRVRALHAKLCKQYEEEASSSAEVVVRPVKYGSPKPPSDDSAEVVATPVKYASPKPPSDDSAEVVAIPVKYASPKPPSDDSAEVVAIPVKYASPKPPSDDSAEVVASDDSAEVVSIPVKYASPKPPSDDSAEVVAIPVKYASPKPPSDDKVDK